MRQFGYTQSRVGVPKSYPIQEGSILYGCRSWLDFMRGDTLGHFLYPLALESQGECLLHYWEWHAQALWDFLLLRRKPSFMSGVFYSFIKGKPKAKDCQGTRDMDEK